MSWNKKRNAKTGAFAFCTGEPAIFRFPNLGEIRKYYPSMQFCLVKEHEKGAVT
jgi:hypothetical protein